MLSSLTGRAVQRQIAGLASVTHFELGIRCVETGRFFKRLPAGHDNPPPGPGAFIKHD